MSYYSNGLLIQTEIPCYYCGSHKGPGCRCRDITPKNDLLKKDVRTNDIFDANKLWNDKFNLFKR